MCKYGPFDLEGGAVRGEVGAANAPNLNQFFLFFFFFVCDTQDILYTLERNSSISMGFVGGLSSFI